MAWIYAVFDRLLFSWSFLFSCQGSEDQQVDNRTFGIARGLSFS